MTEPAGETLSQNAVMRCSPSQRALSPAKYSFNTISLCKPKRDPCGALRLGFARSAKGFDPQNFDYAQDDTQNFCCAILFNQPYSNISLSHKKKTLLFRQSLLYFVVICSHLHHHEGAKLFAPTGRWRERRRLFPSQKKKNHRCLDGGFELR